MIEIPAASSSSCAKCGDSLEDILGAHNVGESDDLPLADSTSGFSIFSDVARPLRHLGAEQLQSPESASAGIIRMRLAKPRLPQSAQSLAERTSDLIARRYSSRGFHVPRTAADPNLYTFAAYEQGQLVGTVSMRFDSPAGLMAEQLYPEEIAGLRERNLRMCEFTRLALDELAMSKEVLGSLFHSCYLYAHVVCGLTNAVIEVNPRHVAFYRRVLHFKQLGEQRHNQRVDAPAVLLALDFSVIAAELDRFFANPGWRGETKSFFVHWFSPEDAAGIVGRLHRDHAARRQGA